MTYRTKKKKVIIEIHRIGHFSDLPFLILSTKKRNLGEKQPLERAKNINYYLLFQ